jgi:hypothetical protein
MLFVALFAVSIKGIMIALTLKPKVWEMALAVEEPRVEKEPNKEKKEKRAELQEKMWALVGEKKKGGCRKGRGCRGSTGAGAKNWESLNRLGKRHEGNDDDDKPMTLVPNA